MPTLLLSISLVIRDKRTTVTTTLLRIFNARTAVIIIIFVVVVFIYMLSFWTFKRLFLSWIIIEWACMCVCKFFFDAAIATEPICLLFCQFVCTRSRLALHHPYDTYTSIYAIWWSDVWYVPHSRTLFNICIHIYRWMDVRVFTFCALYFSFICTHEIKINYQIVDQLDMHFYTTIAKGIK